jgi:hypothetical protein
MTLARAAAFSKCLEANDDFSVVAIEESQRAKGEARWFVVFVPVNPQRLADIADRQQDARAQRAADEGANYLFALDKDAGRPFFWVFNPKSGETYEVDPRGHCSCPDFQYRCEVAGLRCKHLVAVQSGQGRREEFQSVPRGQVPADAVPDLDAFHAALDEATGLPEPEPAPCPDCGQPRLLPACPCEYRDYVPGEELPIGDEAESRRARVLKELADLHAFYGA